MSRHEMLVPVGEKPAPAAMMRDYIAEMARIIEGVDPEAPYPHFDLYWTEPETRWPFWLRIGGDINAGFALVRRDVSHDRTEMAEFFVTPSHRRTDVGKSAARRLIARFRGSWRITERESNAPAIAFWHQVLDGYVAYDETTSVTDAVRREQRFTSLGAGSP
jgi:predicted acetyltransferase